MVIFVFLLRCRGNSLPFDFSVASFKDGLFSIQNGNAPHGVQDQTNDVGPGIPDEAIEEIHIPGFYFTDMSKRHLEGTWRILSLTVALTGRP